MPIQKQKRTERTISFRCPKVTDQRLTELMRLDGDNQSSTIIRAIDHYYQIRQQEQNREQK